MQVQTSHQSLFNFLSCGQSTFPLKSFITSTTERESKCGETGASLDVSVHKDLS